MPQTVSLDDIQNVVAATPGTNTASMSDIASVHPQPPQPSTNTASMSDVVAVHAPAPPRWAAYAKPGPYVTMLSPQDEQQFQAWVKTNSIPWQDTPTADYDMRGYWKAMVSGDKDAHTAIDPLDHLPHYPDTWKTPYHATFSNESMYALPTAGHWQGEKFIPPGKPGTASLSDVAVVHGPVSGSPLVQKQPTFTAPQIAPAKPPQPSTWDKIKAFATHPLVSIGAMPEFALPIAAAESAENYLNANNHPTLAKAVSAYAGAQKAVAEGVSGATSPLGIGVMLGTGGLSSLEGVAGPVIARLVNLGLSGQQIAAAYQNIPEIRKALQTGDVENAAKLITSSLGNVALATWSGLHSLGTVEPATGTEPLSRAPVVKIVDSDAAKAHAESGSNGTAPTAKPTTEPISYRVDNNGTKWAKVGALPEVSIPARLTDPNEIEASARQTAELQRQFIASHSAKPAPDVPTVSRDEILSEGTARILHNAPILQTILDPAKLQTPADISKALADAASHIEQNLDPRVGTRISFDTQKQLAADLGMPVEELLAKKSGTAFSAEQALASRAMLQSSADNVLDLARRAAGGDPQAKSQLALSIATHQEIQNQVAGVTSEAGRALGSFRISNSDLPSVRISKVMAQLKPAALDEATKLLAKIDPTNTSQVNGFIRDITPASTADKLFEGYRNILLSGPATVIKKASSELMMMALTSMQKAVVGGLEKAKSATGVSDNPEAFASEGYWYARGAAQALTHAKQILTGEFDLKDAPGFENIGQRAVKGTLGKVLRAPSTVLERETNLMYALSYFGEVNAHAARQAISEGLNGEALAARQAYLSQHPTPDMSKAAHELALHNTFQNKLGAFGASLSNAIQQNSIAKFLFPFFRTPVNLVKASGEFSPYGLLKGTARGNLPLQVKGLLGSSIAAGVAYLALEGTITGGGPTNFKQRETKEATGWQPYSVKIGNKYYSYHRGEPLGLVLSTVADAVHSAMKDEDPAIVTSKAISAVSHITRNVEDFPFLMQLSGIVDSLTHLGEVNTAERIVDNLLASAVVPAGLKDIAQATDRTVRNPQRQGISNPVPGLAQTIEERIPGLTGRVPADIDVTGQTVQRPVSALGGANPFPWTTQRNDPVTAEMARLGVTVAPAVKTVKRVGTSKSAPSWTLSDDESRQLQLEDTRTLYTGLQQKIASPDWARMKDDRRKELIDSERRRIVGTRFARVAKMRREQAGTVAATQ